MYWKILVNAGPGMDFTVFFKRFDDEAKFKLRAISSDNVLYEITVYDVEAIWYKNYDPVTGQGHDRCDDDVILDIRDQLHWGQNDVIGCQRYEGIP